MSELGVGRARAPRAHEPLVAAADVAGGRVWRVARRAGDMRGEPSNARAPTRRFAPGHVLGSARSVAASERTAAAAARARTEAARAPLAPTSSPVPPRCAPRSSPARVTGAFPCAAASSAFAWAPRARRRLDELGGELDGHLVADDRRRLDHLVPLQAVVLAG